MREVGAIGAKWFCTASAALPDASCTGLMRAAATVPGSTPHLMENVPVSIEHVLQYAALAGKYIRAERPRTPEEYDGPDSSHTIGGQGLVAKVYDGGPRIGGWSVEIVFDYGYGFTIVHDDVDAWIITVYAGEDEALAFGDAGPRRDDYITKRRNARITAIGERLSDPLTMLGVDPKERYDNDWRNCSEILADIALTAINE